MRSRHPLFRRIWPFLLLGSVLLTAPAHAAITGKIVGRVVDDGGTPIPGAAVVVEGRQLGATTDPDGRYFILQVSPGTYVVEARIVGYRPMRQRDVVVNLDRTTQLNFTLSESAIEVDAVTVTAMRPVVETDVTSSQVFITADDAEALPVNSLLDAIGFQAGIDIVNTTNISVRGSDPDELSFQVDGFELQNAIENRSYTAMNQAMVQEVQVLTGAFTAEYSSRAAVVNVVTRDPGRIPTLSGDFRLTPARQQHFGMNAFADDQWDRLIWMSPAGTKTNGRLWSVVTDPTSPDFGDTVDVIDSDYPIFMTQVTKDHAENTPVWTGWKTIANRINYLKNGKVDYGGSDPLINAHRYNWTVDALKQAWDWQHRGWDYAGNDDYYVDMALTTPLPFVPRTGFVFGFKDLRSSVPFPAATQQFGDRVFEGIMKSQIIPTIKLEARARYEIVNTTGYGNESSGGQNGPRDLELLNSGEGSNIVSYSATSGAFSLIRSVMSGINAQGSQGNNKYNIYTNLPTEETIWGAGARLTHTLSPSTYYTVSFEHLVGDLNAMHGPTRISGVVDSVAANTIVITKADVEALPASERPPGWVNADGTVKDMTVTIYQDESPDGHVIGSRKTPDLAAVYYLGGGGRVIDFSSWVTDKVRVDLFSQINGNHAVKSGVEYLYQNLDKDYRRGSGEHYFQYEASPTVMGAYMQDKMEYEGLVANIGLRIDRFDANSPVLFPDNPFPIEWARGGLAQRVLNLGIDPASFPPSAAPYFEEPREADPSYIIQRQIEASLPQADSKVHWKLAPRLGVSHPIGTATKFFFNFGWMYSQPKAGFRFGYENKRWHLGLDSEVEGIGNPNLGPPRTVVYEVGFEQSLRNTYVVRVMGYSKDDEDEPGTLLRVGMSSSVSNGGPGMRSAQVQVFANNLYSSYRGIEVSFEKARGRFVTGLLNLDFRVIAKGQIGAQQDNADPRALDTPANQLANQPQFEPTAQANIVFRTPVDWGTVTGSWALSIMQSYKRGSRYIYYLDGDVNKPKEFHWIDEWRTNLRLTKDVNVGSRSVSFYVDVRNVLNQKRLNLSAVTRNATFSKTYFQDMLMAADATTGELEPKYKIGDPQFDDEIMRRLARDNDWLLYMYPREFQFGVRVNL